MLLVLYFSLHLPFLHFYWLHMPGPFDLRAPPFQLDFIPPSSSLYALLTLLADISFSENQSPPTP
jgi:hypothetical protein